MPTSRPPRNWPSILIDAGLRGLTATEVAREQGMSVKGAWDAARRYGVALRDGKAHGRGGGPKGHTQTQAMIIRKEEKYRALFRDAPQGETTTAFCRRTGIGPDAARRWAAKLGHTFAPSPAASRGTGQHRRKPRPVTQG